MIDSEGRLSQADKEYLLAYMESHELGSPIDASHCTSGSVFENDVSPRLKRNFPLSNKQTYRLW